MVRGTFTAAIVLIALASQALAAELKFRPQEIGTDLTIGYGVTLVDVNDDRKPDIVVVDADRVLWYENPSWERHVMLQGQTARDNVCIAAHDIDGDGKVDFTLGAGWKPSDTHAGGTLQWLTRHGNPNEPWEVRQISEEPTTHRIRWMDTDGDGREELVVAPLFGRDTTAPNFAERGVRILAFSVPEHPKQDRWPMRVLCEETHVNHNLLPTDLGGNNKPGLLLASFEGVSLLTPGDSKADPWQRTLLGAGDQESKPNRGSSEIKRGKLAGGADYLATIEPWHGNQVVVYTRPADGKGPLWNRQVLDKELKWGHAVWCANLDGDADEELIIGVRDTLNEKEPCGLRIYDPRDGGKSWERTMIDPGGVAIEDATAGDLNGDGKIDIVAVGRATKNVKIYWHE